MVFSGRSNDPKLDQVARDVFAMFPQCHRCGQTIATFDEADVRVHLQRVVHRGRCPEPPQVERVIEPRIDAP
jgi:hypothetical protein